MSLGVTYRTAWGRSQDVTLRRPQDIIFHCRKDVGRGRPLALLRGPYGDVYRTSSECNLAEWE